MSDYEKGMLSDMEKMAKTYEASAVHCKAAMDVATSALDRRALLAEASAYSRCAKALYDLAESWRKKL